MKSTLLVICLAALAFVVGTVTGDCVANAQYRTLDGTCNNLIFPTLGSTGQFYRRGDEGAEYEPDGSPVANRPVERVISNKISRGNPPDVDSIRHALMATQFGQFINHDLNNNAFEDPDSQVYADPLSAPELDDSFCFVFANPATFNFTLVNKCLPPFNQVPLFTTKFSKRVVVNNVPEVVTDASAWLDLHHVYGTTGTVGTALRTGSGGRLLTQNYFNYTTKPGQTFNLFQFGSVSAPFNCINCPPSFSQTGGVVPVNPLMDPTLPNPFGYTGDRIWVSGDERIGENGALSMFHLLFIRNHNRHAARFQTENPSWDDEKIFQRARRRNIAEYQNIVLYQYVPTEFGDYFAEKIGSYQRYKPWIDSEINVAFATAAFRYGHSSFRNYAPINQCGVATMFSQPANGALLAFGGQTGGPILPMDVYGQIGSWENVIRGLVAVRTAPNDVMIDATLRDLPFNFPFAGGTDVFALDLHRARENGVPNYARLQKEYGRNRDRIYGTNGCPERFYRNQLNDPPQCFDNLVPYNHTLSENLRTLYGKVNRIDPLLGLLAEEHVPGTSFGDTLGNIIVDTYKRIRDGDRYWFENPDQPFPWDEDTLEAIRGVFMNDLLKKNFDFTPGQVPANPFLSPNNYLANLASSCA